MNQPRNTRREVGESVIIGIHRVDGVTVEVVVDADDAERITGNLVHYAGGPGGHTTYAGIWDKGKKRTVHLHRWVMGATPEQEVDHRNGNGLDNRKTNLRLCSRAQNAAAIQPAHNQTGYIGVREDRRCRTPRFDAFLAGKYIGRFTTAEDAARARDKAAREAYGDFAVLNFKEVA